MGSLFTAEQILFRSLQPGTKKSGYSTSIKNKLLSGDTVQEKLITDLKDKRDVCLYVKNGQCFPKFS